MVESLTDKIRELTPRFVNDRLVVKGTKKKKDFQYDYEIERKFGVSMHWGFRYPQHKDRLVRDHVNLCNGALSHMEGILKQIFHDFDIRIDETGEYPDSHYSSSNFTERPFNERNTALLFEDEYRKTLFIYQIGRILQPFQDIARYLLSLIINGHKDFCDTLNQISYCGERVTQQERILVLESKQGKQVIYTVTPRRYMFRHGIEVLAPGFSPMLSDYPVPVMIAFKGFKSGDRDFRDYHESILTQDFYHLERVFPHVPTQNDIEWQRFDRIIHDRTQRGEYAKSFGARETIAIGLRKGLITFSEAEQLIPGLYDGTVNPENPTIVALRESIR